MRPAGCWDSLQPTDVSSGWEATRLRKRLDADRRDELLDGVMTIIAERGFSHVTIAEIARDLRCSAATLYKIAPSKDSLVLLAIARWADVTLSDLERRALRGKTATEQARHYFLGAAESLRPLSITFRGDVERFESTRTAYQAISDRFVARLVGMLDDAIEAGEMKPMNTRFLGHLLRQINRVIRDEHVLRDSGLTSGQAALQVDDILWDGLRRQEAAPPAGGSFAIPE
jgi:AcrR family transcriptional regulator